MESLNNQEPEEKTEILFFEIVLMPIVGIAIGLLLVAKLPWLIPSEISHYRLWAGGISLGVALTAMPLIAFLWRRGGLRARSGAAIPAIGVSLILTSVALFCLFEAAGPWLGGASVGLVYQPKFVKEIGRMEAEEGGPLVFASTRSDNLVFFWNLDLDPIGVPYASVVNADELRKDTLRTLIESSERLVNVVAEDHLALPLDLDSISVRGETKFNLKDVLGKYTKCDDAIELLSIGYSRYSRYDSTGLRDAARTFHKALEKDSAFIVAYSALIDTYDQLHIRRWDTTGVCLDSAMRYAELGARFPNAYSSLSFLRSLGLLERVKGERAFERRARKLGSGQSRGDALEELRRFVSDSVGVHFLNSFAWFDSALAVNGLCPVTINNYATSVLRFGDILDSLQEYDRSLRYFAVGDSMLNAAIAQNRFYPSFFINQGYLYMGYHDVYRDMGAEKGVLKKWLDMSEVALTRAIWISSEKDTFPSSQLGLALYNLACVQVRQGYKVRAESIFELLGRSWRQGGFNFCYQLRNDPDFSGLKRDFGRQFKALSVQSGCDELAGTLQSRDLATSR